MTRGSVTERSPIRAQIEHDLAYVRTVAEKGRSAPLVSGGFYVIWGAVLFLAGVASYGERFAAEPYSAHAHAWIWASAVVIGWVGSFIYGWGTGAKAGAGTTANQVSRAAWCAAGVSLTVLWAMTMFIHDDFTHLGVPPYFLQRLLMPVAFAFYGAAFFVTQAISGDKWMAAVAGAAWTIAALLMLTLGSIQFLLVGAIGALAVVFAPGVYLVWRERRGTA